MDFSNCNLEELIELMQNDTFEVDIKLQLLQYVISMKENASSLVPELVDFIERNNYPEILSFAIEGLGKIGIASEPAVPIIGNILNNYKHFDSFDYIQNYAAESLGNIGSERAVPFLVEALKDPDSQGPCLAAIYALSTLKSKAQSAVSVLIEVRHKDTYKDYYPAIDKALNEIQKVK